MMSIARTSWCNERSGATEHTLESERREHTERAVPAEALPGQQWLPPPAVETVRGSRDGACAKGKGAPPKPPPWQLVEKGIVKGVGDQVPTIPPAPSSPPPVADMVRAAQAPAATEVNERIGATEHANVDEMVDKDGAKRDLETYCFTMLNILGEVDTKDKLDTKDMATSEAALQDALAWLEDNHQMGEPAIKAVHGELEEVVNRILTKASQASASKSKAVPEELLKVTAKNTAEQLHQVELSQDGWTEYADGDSRWWWHKNGI